MSDETKYLLFQKKKGYANITLNRPHRYNSLTAKTYTGLRKFLESVVDDDEVKLVLIDAVGRYFTSGADLSEIFEGGKSGGGEEELIDLSHFSNFVQCLINFPKLIVVAVNGPAIGVGVTMLPLCDVVYASSQATFMTPFTKNAISPEACSSYTFEKCMGISKASEVLLLNRTLTANEACTAGLVSNVFPHDTFHAEVEKRINKFVELPMQSMICSKRLLRSHDKEMLLAKNKEECDQLKKRLTSHEIAEQFQKFMQQRADKKMNLHRSNL